MTRKLTYEEVKEKVEERGFKMISDTYVKNSVKIIVECENGHEWEVLFGNFYNKKQNCPYCVNKKKKDFYFVKSEIEKEQGYMVLSKEQDFKNTKSILKVKCPKGSLWETNYNRFQQGQRCSCKHCANNRPLTYEEVKEYIESQGETLLSTDYINNSTPLEIMCKEGHIYYPKFNNFKDGGSRCPKCKESKGEMKISVFLSENNFKFEKEYRFKNCKHIRPLPFDFYLTDLNIAIEYDGIQHFIPNQFKMTKEEFKILKQRDRIKTNYCKDNNIKLIRIPYWDFNNIEKILKLKLQHD